MSVEMMEINREEARLLGDIAFAAEAFMSDEKQIGNLQRAVNALKKWRKEKVNNDG